MKVPLTDVLLSDFIHAGDAPLRQLVKALSTTLNTMSVKIQGLQNRASQ
jgi:hypothetical protein